MSAWSRCGQPSCWQTPCFHSMLRGTVGQALMPSRAGLTAAQMSMNGWPTISTCLPTGLLATDAAIRLSLEPAHQVVDEHADPALGPGPEVAQVLGEVVDALEVLHDDALDPQVVAPDLLDELGVVAALDEDPAGPGDPGLGAGHGDRPGRRTRLDGGAASGPAGPGSPGTPSSRKPVPSGKVRRLPRRSSSVTVPRSRSTATISPHQSVVTSSTTRPLSAEISTARPRRGRAPVGVQDVGAVAVVGRHPATLVRRPDGAGRTRRATRKALELPTVRDISSTYRERS